MNRIFVATDDSTLAALKAIGAPSMLVKLEHARSAEFRTSADEAVCVGPRAYELMGELRTRGIAPEALSWQDEVGGKIKDFNWLKNRSMEDVQAPPPDKYLKCGVPGLGKVVNWRLPEIVLVAGPYASGKSLFAQVLAQDFVRQNKMGASFACWEDQEDEIKAALARYQDTAANFLPGEEEFRDKFLSMFRTVIVAEDDKRCMYEHFEMIESTHRRFGTKFFVLDPWNEFLHRKAVGQTEGDYVIDVMTKAAQLANKLKIIMLFTTHVSAEHVGLDQKGNIKPFKIANAFGTSQFGNKVHRGFCVVRTGLYGAEGESHMIVRQDKVKLEDRVEMHVDNADGERRCRFEILQKRMGARATLALSYSGKTNQLYFSKDATEQVKHIWRE